MTTPKKISFFIDGFNLYYSLTNKTKWLDLYLLCYNRLNENEKVAKIFYFTADSLNPDSKSKQITKIGRHTKYINCLKSRDISVVKGFHTQNFIKYKGNKISNIEEKCTDVNLALQTVIELKEEKCDKAIIISADNDFSGIPERIKKFCPDKELHYIFPYNKRGKINKKITRECNKLKSEKYKVLEPFTEDEYKSAQFPSQVKLKNGTTVNIPDEYK